MEAKDRNFRQMLEAQWARDKFVCVGLDSEFSKIPESVRRSYTFGVSIPEAICCFNREIVDTTGDIVLAYKPNAAFYEAHGDEGFVALRRTIVDIHAIAPDVPVILDAKRADIGNTNNGYVEMAFDYLGVDAITVNPYLGAEALQPFLARADKGIIVLCRTSNPGAGEFQDRRVNISNETRFELNTYAKTFPLYQVIAYQVAKVWNKNGNCGLVVGATHPDELREVRKLVGDMPILIPGIGAQGGDVEKTVKAGVDSRGYGMIINSSRGIIFASQEADFAEAARRETEKLHNLINQCRGRKVRP